MPSTTSLRCYETVLQFSIKQKAITNRLYGDVAPSEYIAIYRCIQESNRLRS